MVEVTITGIKEIQKALMQVAKDLESNLELNKELSSTLAQKASTMAPRLTGALASSVQGNPSAQKAQISAGSAAVPYAGAIEYGWAKRNIQPQPYLTPAVNKNMGYIIEKYNDEIKKSVKKYDLN